MDISEGKIIIVNNGSQRVEVVCVDKTKIDYYDNDMYQGSISFSDKEKFENFKKLLEAIE